MKNIDINQLAKEIEEDLNANSYEEVEIQVDEDKGTLTICSEVEYEDLEELCDRGDKILTNHKIDSYFEPDCPGRAVAFIG